MDPPNLCSQPYPISGLGIFTGPTFSGVDCAIVDGVSILRVFDWMGTVLMDVCVRLAGFIANRVIWRLRILAGDKCVL